MQDAAFIVPCRLEAVAQVGVVEKLFAEHRFHYVFHLAAYAAEGLSHFIWVAALPTGLFLQYGVFNELLLHLEILKLIRLSLDVSGLA